MFEEGKENNLKSISHLQISSSVSTLSTVLLTSSLASSLLKKRFNI